MNAHTLSLATAPDQPISQGAAAARPARQFITFTLGAEEYGVNIMRVREIKGWTAVTALPKSPPHVRGVMNLRGVIIPILDLRARFGLGITEPTPMHVTIIVDAGRKTNGLLVDAVSDIVSVEPDAIRPVPELGIAAGENFLDGLVALGDRMVTLVSLERLLGVDMPMDVPAGVACAAGAVTA